MPTEARMMRQESSVNQEYSQEDKEAAEALCEKLKIKDQWESQVKILHDAGILEILPQYNDLGIVAIDGQEYPMPIFDNDPNSPEYHRPNNIFLKLQNPETRKLLETKSEQGFTKMLLVPFGAPLSLLIDRYKRTILKHHENQTLKATNGDTLELDEEKPVYVWEKYEHADENGQLVYHPKQFDKTNHQGKTKEELIQANEAWQVLFLENLPDLSAQGQGQTLNQRKQLEANQTSINYLKTLQTKPEYQFEQGLTPESWLAYALTQLEETGQAIDDWQGQGKFSFLIDSYFPQSGGVPCASWSRDYRQAYLSGSDPGYRGENFGCRPSVMI